ncbi:MAG: glutamate synthase large subunit [Sphaerochaetaceae bacterium]|nr:glutamate synthase large subunit [Sphaerochaetaceae bacterium]
MEKKTLYEPVFEHDNCGIGAVANIDGHQSRDIVSDALTIVERLEHRAGKDASGETGDGVGILVQICHSFFSKVASEQGISLRGPRDYAVGMFFFPSDVRQYAMEKSRFERVVDSQGLRLMGWRAVPTSPEVLGKKAHDCMPIIEQCFIERPLDAASDLDFERKLFQVRRLFEKNGKTGSDNAGGITYICSLSCKTIVYKGMFLVKQLRTFYRDLQSEDYLSAIAIVHSRFSTNTEPSWRRAHPYRYIAHNGEINTIRGNVDRMIAREGEIDTTGSDSAMLDNTLEHLVMKGMPFPLAVMVCIPEPWNHDDSIPEKSKDFYHYWATMMEPWDGPAAVLFSDGDILGATLDRNGLRPVRYYTTDDGRLIISSEVGVLDIPQKSIVRKSRLKPGKMILVDTTRKCLLEDDELKEFYASQYPYGEWLDLNLVALSSLKVPNRKIPVATGDEKKRLYKAFGYSYEDMMEMILPMAKNGSEPTASMGIDTPLAVMSEKHQSLYSYFKQLFAQVTNPPIDSLREKIVTDTTVYVGTDGDLYTQKGRNCNILEIRNPILTGVDLLKISVLDQKGLRSTKVSLLLPVQALDLQKGLDDLLQAIDNAYNDGYNIVILSDRGVDKDHVAIPSLLAVSAVEQYLIRTHRRTKVSIILETGEIRDVHQAAVALGYGARAINPYLAHEAIFELIDQKILDKDSHIAIDDFNKGILDGIVKIAAKMGISAIQSYQSAQIFEAVGISTEVIDRYFTNTVSRVEGIGLKEIQEDILFHHNNAWDPNGLSEDLQLDSVGNHKMRRGPNAEDHLYNPEIIIALQEASRSGDYRKFKEYTQLVDDNSHPHTLRAMLDFNFSAVKPIPIDDVESVDSIVRRFKTGAMSYGSISEEAHKCMAEAMNTLHGKSNSGEGGEKPERLGTIYNSAIKQVASGRFGVTEEYLLSAQEIQIKMAQGAKPGEGGHLPGKKVYPWIAKTRLATPGVSLISPPPHHDIYSIEDLAQLIYDLKNANRKARISVKLVSEAGVGTIAAGVAKAGAQVILISGHDGGTGAAPISSIHHAGLPWELGLAETHQTLLRNGLRDMVIIETDGKLMSGRDVAIACILGAEEFGFATAPLVTMGCAMMRVCNLDTCPFGVATQNEKLRARFAGKPEYIVNFMRFIAQELREYMAMLGVKTIDELCGRVDLIRLKSRQGFKRANLVDMGRIIASAQGNIGKVGTKKLYDFKLARTIDEKTLIPSLDNNKIAELGTIDITCTDRTAATILGSEIQSRYGSSLKEDTFVVHFKGGAGQSFGAFIPKGLTLRLEGDANDAVGKGLSGGKIVVRPDRQFKGLADENIIIGNVAFFGATSGQAFINGIASERFCVRNSGATVVCEGCGDHGLEYMTGGTAVILGDTGKNLCAGMSGGVAYVLDERHDLYKRLNHNLVSMYELDDEVTTCPRTTDDVAVLKALIEKHVKETGSEKGKRILSDWEANIPKFKKIIPNDYLRMMREIYKGESQGLCHDDAVMSAFEKITG